MQQNTQQMTTSAPASTSPKLALKSGLGLPLSRPPPLARLFSEVELGSMRFLILDCPTEQNLHHYLTELRARNVVDVVRVCEPTYDKQALIDVGIALHDWPFKDGGLPPQEILQKFLALSSSRFGPLSSAKAAPPDPSGPVIAVHCVAGLGRAPVLVAVSLIEAGLTPLDAVDFIRKRRRGAFNSVQLQFLVDSYKRRNSGSSWRVGEAARAFFGRKASPSPPPPSMGSVSVQPTNQGPGPSSIAEQSNGNNSGSESPTLSVHSLKESFTKVFKGIKKPSSPTLQPTVVGGVLAGSTTPATTANVSPSSPILQT